MKRRIATLALVILALLAGCSGAEPSAPSPYSTVNDLDWVTLEILSADESDISIAIVNNGGETVCAYGDYYLEQLTDEGWMTVPYATDEFNDFPPFPSSYYKALPGGRSDTETPETVEIGFYFGKLTALGWERKLPAGTYRIIKPVYLQSAPGNWHYLAAEFTLE